MLAGRSRLEACLLAMPEDTGKPHRVDRSKYEAFWVLDCTLGKSFGEGGKGKKYGTGKKGIKRGAEKISFVFSTPCLLFCICTYVLSIFYLGPLFFPDNTKQITRVAAK